MAKLLKVMADFDWAQTRGKKLVVFALNYEHHALTEFAINQIQTQVDPKDYMIIIGNDNNQHNWTHLNPKNVWSFSLIHDTKGPRNGAFIRNYFLRRCESDWVMQKDGEVIVTGDFIYRIINLHTPWRAGKVCVLDDAHTTQILEKGVEWFMGSNPTPLRIIEPFVAVNSYHVKEIIGAADGRINPSTYFHYAYACPTAIFSKIGGYDERFTSYGWEDSDMFCRLFHNGIYLSPDAGCWAIHPRHPRAADSITAADVALMRDVFMKNSPADYIRNKTKEWGSGV